MPPNRKFDTGRFDFLGKAKYLVPLSIITIVVGLINLGTRGLNYGIDFVGGTVIQIQYTKSVSAETVRQVLDHAGYQKAMVQTFSNSRDFLIRTEALKGKTQRQSDELQNALVKKLSGVLETGVPGNPAQIQSVNSVGPEVGAQLKRNSLLATFYSLLMILVYIGIRFDYKYAPGAVFCLIHDAIVTISIYAIFRREVNMQTLASILTLLGYSTNDTIITFDRIRENEKIFRGESFYNIVNRSVNDMLSRTLLTSFTTELAVCGLYFLSGGVIKQITFTLLVGIIIGTYSSIYIAAYIVIWFDRLEKRKAQTRLQTAKASG